jgi:spore coat protein SA
VAIIAGTNETCLHPVPPVADSAPAWNIYRLAEAAGDLDLHVISPCEERQLPALQQFPATGRYHHIVFPQAQLGLYRSVLRHFLPLRLAARRLAKLPDLLSWWYLRQVVRVLENLQPDLVFINDRPQYIRYLRRHVPPGRLLFFMRGEMGESRRFLYLVDGIVVNSQGIADYARELLGGKPVPIYWMPNSLGDEFPVPPPPLDRFHRREKRILYAGRIIPVKGVLELVEAFALVYREIPESRLFLYGASDNFRRDGPLTPYERQVRGRAARLPAGTVQFMGYVPNQEMGAHYVQADVAVFPSIWKESFGMVALEAMRCGTPVVASRRPGFEEVVIPGETGLLVDDPTDIPALAEAILRVLRDPDLARRMGEAGYRHSLEYTPEKAVKRLMEIIGYYHSGESQ